MGELTVCGHHRDLICGICDPEGVQGVSVIEARETEARLIEAMSEVRRLRDVIRQCMAELGEIELHTCTGCDVAGGVYMRLADALDGD